MKFIELFAGIGGFRYGLEATNREKNGESQKIEKNGNSKGYKELKSSNAEGGQPSEHSNGRLQEQFTCVYANEFNKYATQIYEKNYAKKDTKHAHIGEKSEQEERPQGRERTADERGVQLRSGNGTAPLCSIDTRDIRTVCAEEIPDHDLLTAGFPCQSFSIAGKRGGFNDTRGTLFFEVARILKAKRPKYLLLENVKGLLSSKTPLPLDSFMLIYSEEVALEETIRCTNFVPINSWKILTENLGNYLNKIGGLDGLIGRLRYLQTRQELTMKKPSTLTTELMRLYECKEEEWDTLLNQLTSKESLKAVDISILEKAMAINGDAVLKLRKRLGASLNPMKLSTTLTELKLTTDQITFMSAIQEQSIILFILKQWKLSTSLWNKIKLYSKKESIFYVKTFNIILHELSELGYDCQWQVLNSKDFGVPQNRERVFIIGHLRGTSRPEVFPIGNSSKAVDKTKELPEQISNTLRTNYSNAHSNETYILADKQDTQERGDKSDNSNSIRRASYTDDMRIRRLTPTECCRLQGFPDNWVDGISDTQKYKCLGNAVTTNVITAIGKRLLSFS